jgi:cytochrome c-type biogenesis protein CcmF
VQALGFHARHEVEVRVGESGEAGASVVRVWHKPFVTLIWLGALLMAGAGFLSLSYRRLRVGAPRPATARTAAAE